MFIVFPFVLIDTTLKDPIFTGVSSLILQCIVHSLLMYSFVPPNSSLLTGSPLYSKSGILIDIPLVDAVLLEREIVSDIVCLFNITPL